MTNVLGRLGCSVLIASLLLALAGCQASAPSLAGRTFLSVGISENGAAKTLVPGTRIQLDFKDGGISASAGCNTMGGEFQLTDGRLVVGSMSMTAMGCDADRQAQDTWLMRLLAARPGVHQTGDQLTLDAAGVIVQLADRRVVEPDAALVGPTWRVESLLNAETASSVPDGLRATIVFHADGTVDIDAGCNTGGGRWTAEGNGVEIADLAMTKKACDGPAALLENAVLGVLRAPSLVAAIQGNQLLLQGGAQGLQLRAT